MNIYEIFERDLTEDAKEFPLSEDIFITLLPAGSEKAKRAFEQMMEPYSPRLNAGGKLTDKESRDLNVKFYAEHIVKGWRGFKDREQKEIKFSKQAATALFSDKKLEQLFALVIRMASNDAAFEIARTEEDEGNS